MDKPDAIKRDVDPGMLLAMFRQTHEAILKIRQKELRKYDVTPEQLGALIAVSAIGTGATAAQLSRWLFRKPDSTTVLLRRLERKGLIKKTPDTHRKNIIRLSLTGSGKEAIHRSSAATLACNIFDRLSARKKRQLWSILERLRSLALKKLNIDEQVYSGFFEIFKEQK